MYGVVWENDFDFNEQIFNLGNLVQYFVVRRLSLLWKTWEYIVCIIVVSSLFLTHRKEVICYSLRSSLSFSINTRINKTLNLYLPIYIVYHCVFPKGKSV